MNIKINEFIWNLIRTLLNSPILIDVYMYKDIAHSTRAKHINIIILRVLFARAPIKDDLCLLRNFESLRMLDKVLNTIASNGRPVSIFASATPRHVKTLKRKFDIQMRNENNLVATFKRIR